MDVFVAGKLNPHAFEADVRHATHDLADLLMLAAETQSGLIESTHVLIALGRVSGGATRAGLTHRETNPEQWESGLRSCAVRKSGALPPGRLSPDAFHESALALWRDAVARCEREGWPLLSEPVLLRYGLEHATSAVAEECQAAGIDLSAWREEVERDYLRPVVCPEIFDKTGALRLEAFSPGARKVLRLLRSEAESLGYTLADPRHLLLALLGQENGGATHHSLYRAGAAPRKLHGAVMLSLRSRAKKARGLVPLDRDHMQPLLQRILEAAAELAGRGRVAKLGEPHLWRAFLATDSLALRLLADENLELLGLRQSAAAYVETEEEDDDEGDMADIRTVRERLQARVVGQDDAIERILPYVQRMRFGFTTPGRPVGVFLFCGQSGSGKTEMSKELARAVYGSEENLVFLEMGQFNSPESMNIFVGAPPGYVGYGEGKLTNGLRDKPRAVVLFDEVEKAHAKVLDALLRFLDEGKIDDPAGPVRDGSQCIVILTSNVGADELSKLWDEVRDNPNWRSAVRNRLRDAFRRHNFRPEFLNRVDELILFRTLGEAEYAEIARRILARDLLRLKNAHGIDVECDPGVPAAIGGYCHAIGEGARATQRMTQTVVITPVIDFTLRNDCAAGARLRVRAVVAGGDASCEPAGVVERI
jgi:ATP-dependent Clp protease ATP-binding subunit ClpC